MQPGNYGKKRANTYYSSPNSPEMPKPMVSVGHGTWRANKKSMTSSVPNTVSKGSSGRIIRIVNGHDHSVQVRFIPIDFCHPRRNDLFFVCALSQCRVLLNLRTTQPFEEVLDDLGQVLKMGGAKRMFTLGGQEVGAGQKKKTRAPLISCLICICKGMPPQANCLS